MAKKIVKRMAEKLVELEHQTDLGNAKLLVQLARGDLRYEHAWRRWLVWDDRRFLPDRGGGGGQYARRVPDHYHELAAQADDAGSMKQAAKLKHYALECESRSMIANMLALAESERFIAVRNESLDAKPYLLNLRNGTLDLETGRLRPHSKKDLLTKLIDLPYEPQAKCDLFHEFLRKVVPDTSTRRFIKRAMGYSLTGSQKEQVFFILWGPGRNGKSVLIETLLRVLGEYGCTAAPNLLMSSHFDRHPTELASLRGSRFVTVAESGQNRKINEVLLKRLTGADTITARRMREDFWSFEQTGKVWISTNHRPRIEGTDHAMWRRIRLVPFTVTISDDEDDRDLSRKLLAESTGILRWVIEGAREWMRDGLQPSGDITAATNAYRKDQDHVGRFLDEECQRGPLEGIREQPANLLDAYRAWCADNGERALKIGELRRNLEGRGIDVTYRSNGVRYYRGVRLRIAFRSSRVPGSSAEEQPESGLF